MAEEVSSPFVWGAGGAQLTPEQLARRREVANAMMAQGMDFSPVQHWSQGAARVANALAGAYQNSQIGDEEAKGRAGASDAYSKVAQAMTSGGQAPTSDVVSALGNPWLSEGQRSVAQALLQQNLAAQKQANEPFTLPAGAVRYGANGHIIASAPAKGAGDGPRRSLQPIYGVDEQGNPVVLQPGDDGTVARSTMPHGVTVSNKPLQMDAGTHFVLVDPITRQQIGIVPKNVAGAAAAKAEGTATGEARAALPAAEGSFASMNQQITDLAQDPYLPQMLGPIYSRLPNVSADSARVQGRMDQLAGGAFLQARQQLKGGGAITDFESRKAEAALARLNAAQSEGDYKAALEEFRGALRDGLAKLQQAARDPNSTMANAGNYAQPAPAPGGGKNADRAPGGAPAVGQVENGYRYKGGNPADAGSWEKVQ